MLPYPRVLPCELEDLSLVQVVPRVDLAGKLHRSPSVTKDRRHRTHLIKELPDEFHVDVLDGCVRKLGGQRAEQDFGAEDGVLRALSIFAPLGFERRQAALERFCTVL
jgi:hypothetical protein